MTEETRKAAKPQSRKSLDEKLSKDEVEAFYDHSSERSMAIVLGTIVENHLTSLLRLVMRRDTALADELFNPSGPLGPFGTKIRLAYMLRILHETSYKDLIIINRIRNKFAHDLSIKSFEDQQITAWIRNMNIYSIVKKMAEEAKERLANKTSEGRYGHARDFTMSNALLSSRDSFRDCLRFVIHGIADHENRIRDSEAALNAPEQIADASTSQEKS